MVYCALSIVWVSLIAVKKVERTCGIVYKTCRALVVHGATAVNHFRFYSIWLMIVHQRFVYDCVHTGIKVL